MVARSKDQIVMWGGSRTGGTSTLLPLCPRYAAVPGGARVFICAHLGTEDEIKASFRTQATPEAEGQIAEDELAADLPQVPLWF